MSATAFQADLTAAGLSLQVEERGRMAVVIPAGGAAMDPAARRRVVALARQHGFSNVCIELAPRDANLPGD